MKKLFYCSVVAFLIVVRLSHEGYAQKIDLDKVSVKNDYVELPSNGALVPYNTYSFQLQSSAPFEVEKGKKEYYATLEGFEEVRENGEFTYTITIGNATQVPGTVGERSSNVKNAAGQTESVKKYIAILKHSIPTLIKIQKAGEATFIYSNEIATAAAPIETFSDEYDNKSDAEAAVNAKSTAVSKAVLMNYYNALDQEINTLKNTFTFRKKTSNDVFWEINLKKAPEYAEFNQKIASAKNILENQSYSASLEKSKADFQPILQYWNDNVKNVQSDEKWARKLRYAYLMNLAKSYFWLEMLDECEATCKLIVENDYDKSDGKKLAEEVVRLRAEFKSSGLSTRRVYRKSFDLKPKEASPSGIVGNIKSAAKDMKGSVENIKKDFKNTYVRKTVKDTLRYNETDLSELSFTLNGKEYLTTYKELENGWAYPADNGVYKIWMSTKKGLLSNKPNSVYLTLDLFSNPAKEKKPIIDEMLALIKQNAGSEMLDVALENEKERWYGENKERDNLIRKQQYKGSLFAKLHLNLEIKESPEYNGIYHTVNGTKFKMEIIETTPITINPTGSTYTTKGMLVKIKIPEIVLNKFRLVAPIMFISTETITLQNLVCTFVMMEEKRY